jgi:hypothetical protein
VELSERVIEDLVGAFAEELLGEPLELVRRQMTVRNRRIDLLFRDQSGRNVIVEIKRGEITREALGQVGEYLGMLRLEWKDQGFRFIVVGTHIPPERKSYFEAIGAEVFAIPTATLLDLCNRNGVDPVVGIRKPTGHLQPDDATEVAPLNLLGVSDETSFLEQVRRHPDSASSDRVVAVYSMLRSFPQCSWRFKPQGRSVFTLEADGRGADIAYVGLNRKYGSRKAGQYGIEVVILWRNIATTWSGKETQPLRDALLRIVTPEQAAGIQTDAPNKGVYVGINVATQLPERECRELLGGLRAFFEGVTHGA